MLSLICEFVAVIGSFSWNSHAFLRFQLCQVEWLEILANLLILSLYENNSNQLAVTQRHTLYTSLLKERKLTFILTLSCVWLKNV